MIIWPTNRAKAAISWGGEICYKFFNNSQVNKMTETINLAIYKLLLLINLGEEATGGVLPIDTYTFDPGLKEGDSIHIENWKVGFSTENEQGNRIFEFDARVLKIEKNVVRHESYIVNIILESPDREIIAELINALKQRNPELQ